MGASLMKLTPGSKEKEKIDIINDCYDKYFLTGKTGQIDKFNDFYQAVCQTVEEINRKFGNTQICVPAASKLKTEYDHLQERRKTERKQTDGQDIPLTAKEFQELLKYMVSTVGFTNAGALDSLFYIFAAPVTAVLVKQAVRPDVMSNQFLIPGVTSATVFVLAQLKKI